MIILYDFKTYHEAPVVKAAWYLYNTIQLDQWNKIKSPEIDPHIHSALILTKVSKQFNRKRKISSSNCDTTTEYPSGKTRTSNTHKLIQDESYT